MTSWSVRRRLVLPLVAIVAAGLLLIGSPGVAGATTTATTGSRARMMYRGIFISVPVTVTCTLQHTTLIVWVYADQMTEKGRVTGFGRHEQPAPCDGAPHVIRVVVVGETNGRLFRPGPAQVRADAEVCTWMQRQCEFGSGGDWRAVRVVRP